MFLGIPAGFEHFGPQIRIPGEMLGIYPTGNAWKPPMLSKNDKSWFRISFCFYLISGLYRDYMVTFKGIYSEFKGLIGRYRTLIYVINTYI